MSFFDIIGGILELFSVFSSGNDSTERDKDSTAFGSIFVIVLFFAACFLFSCDGIFAINYLALVIVTCVVLSIILSLLLIRLLIKLKITEPLKLGNFIFYLLTLVTVFFTLLLFLNYCLKIVG